MTEREALKLALMAFNEINYDQAYANEISAIKEVLAQPEHGTSAVVRDDGNICYQYTTPPQPELVIDKSAAIRIATALGWEPKRKPLPPQSPCEMTQAEGKMFKLGWLECEAAHGIKE